MEYFKLLIGKFNLNYVLIGLIIYCAVITLLWRLEITSHKLTASQYEAKSQAQIAKNAIENKAREKVIIDAKSSYDDSINKLKEYYANNPNFKYRTIRMQDTTACGVPAESESPSSVNEGYNGTQETVTSRVTNEVQIDAQKASEEITQCLELINFEKKQGDINQ